MTHEEVRNRELAPLLQLKNNYEKMVLCMDSIQEENYEGIKIKNLINWLLN